MGDFTFAPYPKDWRKYVDYYNAAVIRDRTPKTYEEWLNGTSWVKTVGWGFGILLAVCSLLLAVFG